MAQIILMFKPTTQMIQSIVLNARLRMLDVQIVLCCIFWDLGYVGLRLCYRYLAALYQMILHKRSLLQLLRDQQHLLLSLHESFTTISYRIKVAYKEKKVGCACKHTSDMI